jgi:hypothetical protein
MTIVDQSSSITYTGNDATTVWDYDFIIPDADSARVGLFDIATGVLTEVDASDYTITGINEEAGGTVTYPLAGAPLSTDTRIVIWRLVPYEQETQLTNQTPYYASVLTRQLDLIVMQIQQLRDEANRSIKVTLGSALTPDEFVEDLQQGAADAQASATAAAASASAAASSASAASTSETNAATSATNASNSASAASTSASNAATSASAAATSATAAQTAETNAETAETNAETAQAAAEAARDEAVNVVSDSVAYSG